MGIYISPQRTRRFTIFIPYRVIQSNRIYRSVLLTEREREELCVLHVLCGEIVHFRTVMNQILVQLPCILSDKSKYQSSFFITSQREDQELELK